MEVIIHDTSVKSLSCSSSLHGKRKKFDVSPGGVFVPQLSFTILFYFNCSKLLGFSIPGIRYVSFVLETFVRI